jgi:hypothetical protein
MMTEWAFVGEAHTHTNIRDGLCIVAGRLGGRPRPLPRPPTEPTALPATLATVAVPANDSRSF